VAGARATRIRTPPARPSARSGIPRRSRACVPPRPAVDDRHGVGLGPRPYPAGEPPGQTHQMRVVQLLVRASQPPPPPQPKSHREQPRADAFGAGSRCRLTTWRRTCLAWAGGRTRLPRSPTDGGQGVPATGGPDAFEPASRQATREASHRHADTTDARSHSHPADRTSARRARDCRMSVLRCAVAQSTSVLLVEDQSTILFLGGRGAHWWVRPSSF
jgi:hypothetical protein